MKLELYCIRTNVVIEIYYPKSQEDINIQIDSWKSKYYKLKDGLYKVRGIYK